MHTESEVTRLLDEELAKLLSSGREAGTAETLRAARDISEAMIRQGAHDPV